MDRRNGGDPPAPPRPPKLLPRVHRSRAPEPTMICDTTNEASVANVTITNTPQCTNQPQLSRNNNLSQQQIHSINDITPTTSTTPTTQTASLSPARSNISNNNNNNNNINNNTNNNNNSYINNNNNGNSNNINSSNSAAAAATASATNNNNTYRGSNKSNNVAVIGVQQSELDDYQIHHLTFLPQRQGSLGRSSSHVNSSSSTSATSITATNSFTRRRPPPPTPGVAVPLLAIVGNSSSSSSSSNNNNSSSSNNNNFLSHFHNSDPTSASPVTLAQPRPESERLTNEYVDTPLRTAQQLQHATRIQHPAGQHDNGQTTTHHLLLLPQRELRHQQQQQHQHQQQQQQQQLLQLQPQQHSHRVVGTAGPANATMDIDGTESFLHSNHSHKAATESTCPHSALGESKVPPGPHPISQPITKQPASSITKNSCKFVKDVPALDELLDMHHVSTGMSTAQAQGLVSVSAATVPGPLGTPIIIGGGGDASSLNPITCPRCERCRCEQCQSPRSLPQTWVCNKTCLCSAESIIDYASCLCCAKALFYHCARDNDMDCDDVTGTPCVDNPCSCGPYKRTQRWGWLGALSIVLPCLWCYWPMRGCVTLCEKCYGRYAGHGCRCQQVGSTSSMLPIVSLGVNGGSAMAGSGAGPQGGSAVSAKSAVGSHHHHHNECSAAGRILRKGDLTPEKRLLDSSPEY